MSGTEYRIVGITTDDGWVTAQLAVGKSAWLVPIHLERHVAWRLSESLLTALRRTEVDQ